MLDSRNGIIGLAVGDAMGVTLESSGEINLDDIAKNFVKWAENAEFTPTGKRFGIGRTCMRAIMNYERGFNAIESGLNNELSNGNGSLMRISPLIYYCYAKNLNEEEIYHIVKDVSSITHRHEVCIIRY